MPRIRRPGIGSDFYSLENSLSGNADLAFGDHITPLWMTDDLVFDKEIQNHPKYKNMTLEEVYMEVKKQRLRAELQQAMRRRMERQQDMGVNDTRMFPRGMWYRAPYNFTPGRRM